MLLPILWTIGFFAGLFLLKQLLSSIKINITWKQTLKVWFPIFVVFILLLVLSSWYITAVIEEELQKNQLMWDAKKLISRLVIGEREINITEPGIITPVIPQPIPPGGQIMPT